VFGVVALLLALSSGCSQGDSGNPKDFGPVDTSQAIKSEDAKTATPGVAADSSGAATPAKK